MARAVAVEGRFGERWWLREARGGGTSREEAERVARALVTGPESALALRGLVFAAAAVDASRLELAALRRLVTDLLVQGRLAHEREEPPRESGQAGRSAPEREGEDSDAPLVDTDWIGLELVDAHGEPVAWEPYIVELPDGRQLRGKLGPDGKAVVRGIPAGQARITFPRRGASTWEPAGA